MITVTGFKHYIIRDRIAEGTAIFLQKEPENQHDKYAVAAFTKSGKIGYVANNEKTVRKGTMNSKQLCEAMDDSAWAEIIEFTSYDAICRVNGVFDADKMILRAFEYYNEFDFAHDCELFTCLGEKYNSVLLLQYTADCLIKLQKYQEALPYIENALKQEENNKVSLMMYGDANEKLKNYDKAISCYTKILSETANPEVKNALKRCQNAME